MKRAGITGGPAAIGGFLINHGEKLAFGLLAAFALTLAWWGISAVRSESVGSDRTPAAIRSLATAAEENIDRAAQPPAGSLASRKPLGPAIDPWRPGRVQLADPPPPRAFLNRPLMAELTKRTKPEVFPLEDLRAVAGIAVLPDARAQRDPGNLPLPPRPDLLPRPDNEDARRKPARGRPRRDRDQPDDGLFGQEGSPGPAQAEPQQPGKVTPFVVVTGLIPAAKQRQEYERRFASTSYRDPGRDQPRWAVYLVERARVVPGGELRWERMELTGVERSDPGGRVGMAPMAGQPGADGGPALEAETLPQGFFLQPDETEIGYAAALPQRIDEPWGAVTMHPWFVSRLEEFLKPAADENQAEEAPELPLADLLADPASRAGGVFRVPGVTVEAAPEQQRDVRLYKFGVRSADVAVPIETIGLSRKPVFAISEKWGRQMFLDGTSAEPRSCNLRIRIDMVGKTPVARILELELLAADGTVAGSQTEPSPEPVAGAEGIAGLVPEGPAGPAVPLADNRLFRFIDTDVKPGETYRYRVKFALRNPNVRLAPRHLARVTDARDEYLVSEYSNQTAPVRVPDPIVLAARTIDKDTARKLRLKGDAVEVMVLAPSQATGNFALRSTITDVGGLADVDMALNRAGDVRFFGETIATDRVLVDVRGSWSEREEIRSPEPPPPLEMLFLKPDGSFELVTAADSERRVAKYGGTLFKPGTRLPDDGRTDRREREAEPPFRGLP